MSKFCTNCGQKLNNSDKFCPSCGEKQVVAESSNAAPVPANIFSKDTILKKELGKLGLKSGAIGGFKSSGLLGAIGGGLGGKLGAGWAASKLRTDEVHDKAVLQKNITSSMTTVLQALSSMGTIIDASQYSDYPVVSACVGSGYANMNPAVICVEFVKIGDIQTDLHISGYAKEGLIKQKTAIKAIERLKSMVI